MMRTGGIIKLTIVGTTAASLWLSPAVAAETLPGATVESVVAFAKRLNPTVAAAALDFDAPVHKIGTAGVLADPALVPRNGFQASPSDISPVFLSEQMLRTVQLGLLKPKMKLQTKYAEMKRLAGGAL